MRCSIQSAQQLPTRIKIEVPLLNKSTYRVLIFVLSSLVNLATKEDPGVNSRGRHHTRTRYQSGAWIVE
jgi:hypothetical protein